MAGQSPRRSEPRTEHPAIKADPRLAEVPRKHWLNSELQYTDKCEHPPSSDPFAPRGYVSRASYFERKLQTHVQRRCRHCGLFVVWEPNKKAGVR